MTEAELLAAAVQALSINRVVVSAESSYIGRPTTVQLRTKGLQLTQPAGLEHLGPKVFREFLTAQLHFATRRIGAVASFTVSCIEDAFPKIDLIVCLLCSVKRAWVVTPDELWWARDNKIVGLARSGKGGRQHRVSWGRKLYPFDATVRVQLPEREV